jgi:hypothetical protein
MFGHRSFLKIGDTSASNILSLISGGYEILDCNYSFNQGVDNKGRATTRVYGGIINVTISQLPPDPIIEWALQPRKYLDGIIALVNAENVPLEKLIFKQAACVDMEVNFTQTGSSYMSTKLIIQTQKLVVGDGIDFDNEWTDH